MSESKETAEWHDEFEETARKLFALVSMRGAAMLLDMKYENTRLREALKKARWQLHNQGYTMREIAAGVGITPTQLSAWTDEIPDRQPDFKD